MTGVGQMTDEKRKGRNVVFLPDAGDEDGKYPAIRDIRRYWQEVRGDRLMPMRSEIDPRRIDRALEFTFVLERLAPGVARFRLAGMHLNALMGMEIRGMPLTTLFLPDARREVSEALESVFDKPAMAVLSATGDRGIGKPPLDARMLLLPLVSDLGEVSRVLGCLASLGPIGRTPRRFAIQDVKLTSLVGELPQPGSDNAGWDRPSETGARDLVDGFAESRRDFTATRPDRPAGGKPHLYLVKSDD